jgi:hypothetical protein
VRGFCCFGFGGSQDAGMARYARDNIKLIDNCGDSGTNSRRSHPGIEAAQRHHNKVVPNTSADR